MFNFTGAWRSISHKMFSRGLGCQIAIVDTKFLRIFIQRFTPAAHVKKHCHNTEWEIVLGGPKRFRIYPPGKKHDLFWKNRKGTWKIISIKIGKKS